MSTAYWQLLRDPRWQRKRLEILNRSDFSCDECGATDKTLNVHHKSYKKGAKPWEYEEHELASLCEECHKSRHDIEKEIRSELDARTTEELWFVLGFLQTRSALEGMGAVHLRNESHLDGASKALGHSRQAYDKLMEHVRTSQVLSGMEAHDIYDVCRVKSE